MLPENLKLAAEQRRELLDQLLAEAGNPDPDRLMVRPPTVRCVTEYDPFGDGQLAGERIDPCASGDTRQWKDRLARLTIWAVQTVELLRKYDEVIARHFEKLPDNLPHGYNAAEQFCKLAREQYCPTLDGVIGDPMSAAKRLREAVEAVGAPSPRSVVQNFHGPVASVQGGSGSFASVVQDVGAPAALPNLPATRGADAAACRRFQQMSMDEARKCVSEAGRESPKVGVVVVKNGEVLAVAHRGELKQGEHGEFTALERKLGDAILAGCVVFTTLEPCTTRNHPKQPCADWLIQRRVAKVYIGMLDPNPDIFGRGVQRLKDAGIKVALYEPEYQEQAEELNRAFVREERRRATERATEKNGKASSIERRDWTNVAALLRVEFRFPTLDLGCGTCAVGVCIWTIQRLPPGIKVVELELKVVLNGEPLSHVYLERNPMPLEPIGKSDLWNPSVKLDKDFSECAEVTMRGELYLTLDVPGEAKDVRVRLGSEPQVCRVKRP